MVLPLLEKLQDSKTNWTVLTEIAWAARQDPGQAIDPNTLREQILRIAAVLGPSEGSYQHSPYLPLLGIERKYYPNNPYPSLLSYLIRGRC